MKEISQINKKIKVKSKKIKEIKSSNDYINKHISDNKLAFSKLEEKYKLYMNNIKKTKNEYIKMLKYI